MSIANLIHLNLAESHQTSSQIPLHIWHALVRLSPVLLLLHRIPSDFIRYGVGRATSAVSEYNGPQT